MLMKVINQPDSSVEQKIKIKNIVQESTVRMGDDELSEDVNVQPRKKTMQKHLDDVFPVTILFVAENVFFVCCSLTRCKCHHRTCTSSHRSLLVRLGLWLNCVK